MAQKIVWLPEIGELTLSKRKGSRHIRLSVSADGRVKVGLPTWLPYSVGIEFAQRRKQWLLEHKAKNSVPQLKDGDRIGKSHRLRFVYDVDARQTTARLSTRDIVVKSANQPLDNLVQAKVRAAAERALRSEAEKLLPVRLTELAERHGFEYRSLKIKKMTSRWGSCSNQKTITLNFFLMQLPWQLIDYVLVHELVHTKHLDHSSKFWQAFESVYPDAKQLRKQTRSYRPVINSIGPNMA